VGPASQPFGNEIGCDAGKASELQALALPLAEIPAVASNSHLSSSEKNRPIRRENRCG
jgi:hypothetical protein